MSTYGISFFDASLNIMATFGGNPELAVRLRATLYWVRASCEAEGLPPWCVEMVITRFQSLLLAGEIAPLPLSEYPTPPRIARRIG